MTITAQLHIALLTETEQKLKAYDTHAQKTIEYYQNALDRGLGDSGTKVDWKADAGLRSGDTTPSLPQGDIGQRKEQDEYTKNMIEYYQKALKERALAEVGAKGDSGSRSGDTTPVLAQGDAGQRKIVTFAADSAPGDGKGQAFGVGGGQRPGEIARIGSYDASRDPRLR